MKISYFSIAVQFIVWSGCGSEDNTANDCEHGLLYWDPWVEVSALLFASYVTLGKIFNLCGSHFPIFSNLKMTIPPDLSFLDLRK